MRIPANLPQGDKRMTTDSYAAERKLAEDRGWYCKWVEGIGWEVCDPADEGAGPDLNRAGWALHVERGTIHQELRLLG
jgi:hypothetical protein